MEITTRALLLCLALLFSAESALALRVLVVRPAPSDAALFEAFGRLRAELELQGFDVVVLRSGARAINMSALEAEAQSRDAFAAVALERDAGSTIAEVHIVDRVTGKTVTRKLKIASGRDGPMLLAIRAADLLRTSLLELEPGEQAPTDVIGAERKPPRSEIVRFAHEPPPFQIAAGAAAFWHPMLGEAFGASFGVRYRPLPELSLGIEFSGPAFGGEYESANGAAAVRQELFVFRTALNLGATEPGPRLEWGPAFAVGVAHLDARGDVDPPLVSQSRDLFALALLGGAYLEAYLDDSVSIALQLGALGLVPQPVIAVADRRSEPLTVQGASSLRLGVSF